MKLISKKPDHGTFARSHHRNACVDWELRTDCSSETDGSIHRDRHTHTSIFGRDAGRPKAAIIVILAEQHVGFLEVADQPTQDAGDRPIVVGIEFFICVLCVAPNERHMCQEKITCKCPSIQRRFDSDCYLLDWFNFRGDNPRKKRSHFQRLKMDIFFVLARCRPDLVSDKKYSGERPQDCNDLRPLPDTYQNRLPGRAPLCTADSMVVRPHGNGDEGGKCAEKAERERAKVKSHIPLHFPAARKPISPEKGRLH